MIDAFENVNSQGNFRDFRVRLVRKKKIEILVNRRRTRRDRLESRVASGMAGLEKGRLESNRLLDPAFLGLINLLPKKKKGL